MCRCAISSDREGRLHLTSQTFVASHRFSQKKMSHQHAHAHTHGTPPPPPPSEHGSLLHRAVDPDDQLFWSFLQKGALSLAEFFGTWLFVLAIITATALDPVGPLAAGVVAGFAYLALAAATLALGSGHFNPYLSIAYFVLGYMPGGYSLGGALTTGLFVGFQILGGLVAAWTLQGILGNVGTPVLGVAVPGTGTLGGSFWLVVLIEFIGTTGLIFVMLQMTRPYGEKRPWTVVIAPLAIGAYIIAYVDVIGLIAQPGGAGSMNLARSLGPAIVSGTYTRIGAYIIGGFFGMAAGAALHVLLRCLNDPHCWRHMLEEALLGVARTDGGHHRFGFADANASKSAGAGVNGGGGGGAAAAAVVGVTAGSSNGHSVVVLRKAGGKGT